MTLTTVLDTVFLAVGLAIALPVHEYSHAWMSMRLGDMTPSNEGRLTLAPGPHADPLGSFILPGIILLPILFGRVLWPPFAYAKPQGQNPWTLRRRTRDAVTIALAGPAANLLLTFLFGLAIRASGRSGRLGQFLFDCLLVNVTFVVLNLVPLPPFDGARVLAQFLAPRPREVFTGWEPLAPLFIIVIFFIFGGPIFDFVNVVGRGICGLATGLSCGA
jgi:Zn-dependent protease